MKWTANSFWSTILSSLNDVVAARLISGRSARIGPTVGFGWAQGARQQSRSGDDRGSRCGQLSLRIAVDWVLRDGRESSSDFSHDFINLKRLQKVRCLCQHRSPFDQNSVLARLFCLQVGFVNHLLDDDFPFFEVHCLFLGTFGVGRQQPPHAPAQPANPHSSFRPKPRRDTQQSRPKQRKNQYGQEK